MFRDGESPDAGVLEVTAGSYLWNAGGGEEERGGAGGERGGEKGRVVLGEREGGRGGIDRRRCSLLFPNKQDNAYNV